MHLQYAITGELTQWTSQLVRYITSPTTQTDPYTTLRRYNAGGTELLYLDTRLGHLDMHAAYHTSKHTVIKATTTHKTTSPKRYMTTIRQKVPPTAHIASPISHNNHHPPYPNTHNNHTPTQTDMQLARTLPSNRKPYYLRCG